MNLLFKTFLFLLISVSASAKLTFVFCDSLGCNKESIVTELISTEIKDGNFSCVTNNSSTPSLAINGESLRDQGLSAFQFQQFLVDGLTSERNYIVQYKNNGIGHDLVSISTWAK